MGTAVTPKAQHWDNQLPGRVRYPSSAPIPPLRHPPDLSLGPFTAFRITNLKISAQLPWEGKQHKRTQAPGA